jgi:hypothetical protein
LKGPINIRVLKTRDKRSQRFKVFFEELVTLAPKVTVLEASGEDEDLPGFEIGNNWQYHLIPAEAELMPFLGLMERIARRAHDLPTPLTTNLVGLSDPADVIIFVTTQCTNCPHVVQRITPLPIVNPLIHVHVIDGLLFPELASPFKIRSVPTVICNGQFRWTGSVALEEIVEALTRREPDQLGIAVFERLIEEGRAGVLADMILQKGDGFPVFLDLITHFRLPIRLGAMVALEEIGSRNPPLAKSILESLWRRVKEVDNSVKGDIIYLVGELADASWVSRLLKVHADSDDPEIGDAVEDAVAKLSPGDGS